jgi:hypothetical protein
MVVRQDSSNTELMDLQLASDQQALAATLAALAGGTRAAAARPEGFWRQQQAEIQRRIADSERSWRRAPLRAACATGLALVAIAAALLATVPGSPPPHVATPKTMDADQELLVAVEQAVQSGVPDALAPASLLSEEISQAAQTSSQVRHKEIDNDN